MRIPESRGFVLPYGLLLASALLSFATLFLLQGQLELSRLQGVVLRQRMDTTVRVNCAVLSDSLGQFLAGTEGASALLPVPGQAEGLYRPKAVGPPGMQAQPLHSPAGETGQRVWFTSPASPIRLEAGMIELPAAGSGTRLALAWAMEDLSLYPTSAPPPAFWPLPGWNWAPEAAVASFENYMDRTTRGLWREGPWVPAPEALPMRMESSPALVPVVEGIVLKLGIFASGPVRGREKVIRVRYYLEGRLWNPYNRDLRVHFGSGWQPVFQVAFWNLPEVRIHNLNTGMSTGWLSLDEARNATSGLTGISGWIRLPAVLSPGESLTFQEPEAGRQPEGLARTLHPAFMVGPADQILLEFNQPEGGLYAACFPLEDQHPLDAGRQGFGWFRVESFPVDLPSVQFSRADERQVPFYLEGGSLSFRRENAYVQFAAEWRPEAFGGLIDQRRKEIRFAGGHPNVEGGWSLDRDAFSVTATHLKEAGQERPAGRATRYRIPIFSWPESEPQNLLAATDLPSWPGGFRLGSRNATKVNQLLDQDWRSRAADPDEGSMILRDRSQEPVRFRAFLPVNLLSLPAWISVIGNSGDPSVNRPGFPAYPRVDASRGMDYRFWEASVLEEGIKALIKRISLSPSHSVSHFLDRGWLAESFPPQFEDDAVHHLMPVRGWLRSTPGLRGKGAAWLLHLAVHASQEGHDLWRTARAWLLDTGQRGAGASLELIRFEWTDPASHLGKEGQTPTPSGWNQAGPGIGLPPR